MMMVMEVKQINKSSLDFTDDFFFRCAMEVKFDNRREERDEREKRS